MTASSSMAILKDSISRINERDKKSELDTEPSISFGSSRFNKEQSSRRKAHQRMLGRRANRQLT